MAMSFRTEDKHASQASSAVGSMVDRSSMSGKLSGKVDKEGHLWRRNKGIFRTTWKSKYFALCGSSLYYYNRTSSDTKERVVQLKGAMLVEPNERRKFIIGIHGAKHGDFYVCAAAQPEFDGWMLALRLALARDAAPPPTPDYVAEQRQKLSAVQAKIIDAASSFPPSKKVILEFITDDLVGILDAAKSFASKYTSQEEAEAMESRVLNVGMSVALLYKEKKIARKELLTLKEPLHELSSVLIDGYEIPFCWDVNVALAAVDAVRDGILKILTGHLNDKTQQSLVELFDFWGNKGLLEEFFQKRKWKECGEVGSLLRKMWEGDLAAAAPTGSLPLATSMK